MTSLSQTMVQYWFKDNCQYTRISFDDDDDVDGTTGVRSSCKFSREESRDQSVQKFVDHDFHLSQPCDTTDTGNCDNSYDVTLHVGGHNIKAHRAVLSAFSKYFRVLFHQDMKESKQSDIDLWELDGFYVKMLVDFAYTSEILITPEHVQGILETANFLAVDSVCRACCKYILTYLNSDNCVGVFHLADAHGLLTLKKEAYKSCVLLFNNNVRKGKIDFFYPQLFIEILKSENLLIDKGKLNPSTQEHVILKAALSFVYEDVSSRAVYLPDILSVVRLPLIAHDYLQELKTNHLVEDSRRCTEIIEKALRTPVCSVSDANASFWCKPRQHSGLKFKCSEAYGIRETTTFFNDRNTKSYVVGMKIFMENTSLYSVLRGLTIFYGNSKQSSYGQTENEDTFLDVHEFKISDYERITRVDVIHGLSLNQMTFYAGAGQFGPYGNIEVSKTCQWNSSTTNGPEEGAGFLAYLKGSIVHSEGLDEIVELQFVWGYYDFDVIRDDTSCENTLCITKSFIKLKA